jgi:hypothetical protein
LIQLPSLTVAVLVGGWEAAMEELERLRIALTAAEEARHLVRAQEIEVARMKAAGLDATRAETLLRVFTEGARLADEQVVFVRRSFW